jgi:cysteinyl-tRNA synthetase
MHNGFLNIDQEKMSKSLGNFFTLREIFKEFDPLAVRFFLLSAHYKAPLNFNREALQQSESGLRRFNDFILRLDEAAGAGSGNSHLSPETAASVRRAQAGFQEGMDDDMNVSRSMAALAELMRDVNIHLDRGSVSSADASALLEFFREIDGVLGVFTFKRGMLSEEVEKLIDQRREARIQKDYARADRIRDQLAEQGIVLVDTRGGTRWKRQ